MDEVMGLGRAGHGGDDEWLDYARSLGDEGRRAQLASHLQSGCSRCQTSLRFWEAASDVAARDRGYAPPDALIRQAKGAFALRRPAATARDLVASIVFDSLLQPLTAGVRAAAAGPRLLLYKAGRYEIRISADHAPGAAKVSLVGQVVDEMDPEASLGEMTVMVYDGKESIDRTTTNRLGEFAIEFVGAARSGFQIAIGVPDERFLTVALPIARTGATEARPREADQLKRGRR